MKSPISVLLLPPLLESLIVDVLLIFPASYCVVRPKMKVVVKLRARMSLVLRKGVSWRRDRG